MMPSERFPRLLPSALDDEQRSLYDAIAKGRRAQGRQLFPLVDEDGRLEGPFNAFLFQPQLGTALQALGTAVRYGTGLDGRCREIAILAVSAYWRSSYEWYAHEAVGRSVGLSDAELATVRAGRGDALEGREAVIMATVNALLTDGDLDDAQFGAALEQLGPAGLFELLTLVGYYATLALQLRVLRVTGPDSSVPPAWDEPAAEPLAEDRFILGPRTQEDR